VVGAGSFGRNHLRVIHQSPNASLAGVLDLDGARARQAAETPAVINRYISLPSRAIMKSCTFQRRLPTKPDSRRQ
jgi:hypothetical protein